MKAASFTVGLIVLAGLAAGGGVAFAQEAATKDLLGRAQDTQRQAVETFMNKSDQPAAERLGLERKASTPLPSAPQQAGEGKPAEGSPNTAPAAPK